MYLSKFNNVLMKSSCINPIELPDNDSDKKIEQGNDNFTKNYMESVQYHEPHLKRLDFIVMLPERFFYSDGSRIYNLIAVLDDKFSTAVTRMRNCDAWTFTYGRVEYQSIFYTADRRAITYLSSTSVPHYISDRNLVDPIFQFLMRAIFVIIVFTID